MARSGMVRLGPLALILALAGAPTRGALMRYEFSGTITEAPAGSPPRGSRFTGGFVSDRFGASRLSDHTADEIGVVVGLADGLIPRPGAFDLKLTTGLDSEGTSSPAYLQHDEPGGAPPGYILGLASHPSPPIIPWDGPILPADGTRREPSIDADPSASSPEPPLTLAFLLGVSAWAAHRAWARRRPERFARPRRVPPPARSPGTAIVLANRPRPAERGSIAGPRMLEATAPARPLILAATFVEVSTRIGPPAIPAWRPDAGATAVSVRRSRAVRRIPA